MTDIGQRLLHAVCLRPDDLEARLVYADWLEDNGETYLSEFIRVQIELTAWGAVEGAALWYDAPELIRRERELLETYGESWLSHFPGNLVSTNGAGNELAKGRGDKRCVYTFRNGFVEEATCTAQQWLNTGPQIVAATPVTKARLTDGFLERMNGGTYTVNGMTLQGTEGSCAYGGNHEFLMPIVRTLDQSLPPAELLSAAAVLWARRQAGLERTA